MVINHLQPGSNRVENLIFQNKSLFPPYKPKRIPVIAECLPWESIGNYSAEAFKDYGLDGNFCRNPDKRAAPYCYYRNAPDELNWEYCSISRCETEPMTVSALPSALFQNDPFDEKVSSEFRRRSNYPSDVEFTPEGVEWENEQKRSSRRTKLPFEKV